MSSGNEDPASAFQDFTKVVANMSSATGKANPLLICLHYLGGSGSEWSWMSNELNGSGDVVAFDLPGFGGSSGDTRYAVADMADAVAEQLPPTGQRPMILCGHSMGAKVAVVLAHRAGQGDQRLASLAGLALLAGSPPSPEPIPDGKRREMLGWCAVGRPMSAASAELFVAQNVGSALPLERKETAVEDARHCNPAAWQAWLEAGSREDWADRIGVLSIPALIVAGAADAALGEQAQHRLMAPHFARPRMATLPGAGHLLPLERPVELARLIGETFLMQAA